MSVYPRTPGSSFSLLLLLTLGSVGQHLLEMRKVKKKRGLSVGFQSKYVNLDTQSSGFHLAAKTPGLLTLHLNTLFLLINSICSA